MSGRRSDIGFKDDPKGAEQHEPELYEKFGHDNTFMCYHAQSVENFETFAKAANLDKMLVQICKSALAHMYMSIPSKTIPSKDKRDRVHTCAPRAPALIQPSNARIASHAALPAGSSMFSSCATTWI